MTFSREVLRIDAAKEVERIASALREMVIKRLRKRGAVVGLSGGIDSSVVAALCVRAFGKARVHGLLMPERDSSRDIEGKRAFAEYLHAGVEAAVQAVKNSYYESVEELSAAYAVHIVQGHVKRAGAAAMLAFLAGNGVRLRLSSGVVPRLMIELQARAEAGEDTGRLVEWLADAVRRATPKRRRSMRHKR